MGLPQKERLQRLNEAAIRQLKSLSPATLRQLPKDTRSHNQDSPES